MWRLEWEAMQQLGRRVGSIFASCHCEKEWRMFNRSCYILVFCSLSSQIFNKLGHIYVHKLILSEFRVRQSRKEGLCLNSGTTNLGNQSYCDQTLISYEIS
jgi:hypothetical protein